MKKLALVILLAVAASWLLSESPGPPPPPPPAMEVYKTALAPWRAEAPSPPESIPTVPWHQADPARPKRTSPIRPTRPAPPWFPKSEIEESPPDSIPTVPWRQADPARPKRTSPIRPTRPAPPWFPKSEIEEEARARPDAAGSRVLIGRLSASEDRARQDLRKTLEREVADWTAADVPPTWKLPAAEVDALMQGAFVQPVTRNFKPAVGDAIPEAASPATPEIPGLDDLYTLYRAGQKVDFSASRKARYVEMYRHELASQRMQRLGGGLAMALACLAVLTGYIRADEATRGYYSNRLRLASLAGLGAAGAAAYRFLS